MDYSQLELDRVVENIYKKSIKNKVKVTSPKAYLLGGQPGAGKTTLTEIINDLNNENIIVINGDKFRKKHPKFKELKKIYGDDVVKYTQKFSGQVTEKLIEKCGREKYNLIIEGTLRTVDVPLKTANLLKKMGYEVELSVIQVKPEFSYLGTLQRYEDMFEIGTTPRMTPKEHHDLVVEKIVENLDEIYKKEVFSNITIYTRERKNVYSLNETPNKNPSQILKNEFLRELTLEERKNLLQDYNKILEKMLLRKAKKEEIILIKRLIDEVIGDNL